MIALTVDSDHPTDAVASGPLPMRGAVLAALASAFRLGNQCRDQAAGLSQGTAKRVLQDEPAVRAEKRTAVARTFILSLFPIGYLRSRGLDEHEAAVHDELLVAALEDALDRWEDVARFFNHLGKADMRLESLLAANRHDMDIIARTAAYLCLYPRLHPVLGALESWFSKPGLKGVYEELMGRIGRPVSLEQQCRDTGLKKNTLKAIRDGETDSPQGETLERLAAAFAKYGTVRRDEDSAATAAEIEVELRVAAALAQARHELREEPRREWVSVQLMRLRHLRSELRRFSPHELAGLVARGSRSPLWKDVEGFTQAFAVSVALQTAAAMQADVARCWSRFPDDAAGAMREAAEGFTKQANSLRRVMAYHRIRDDAQGGHVADIFDDMAELLRSTADACEGKQTSESFKPKADLTITEAMGLTMKAVLPWYGHTPEEQEALLREAIAKNPSISMARFLLAYRLSKRGNMDEAIAHVCALVGEHPDDHEARYELALHLSCANRPAEAIEELEALDDRGGSSASTHALRGQCLLDLGRPIEAESAFRRAISENERLIAALDGMARCRRLAGDEREAREYERRAAYYGGTKGL